MLASILERRLRKDRESGKAGRSVVRIRGVTDDAAAAFVRLLDAGRYGGTAPLRSDSLFIVLFLAAHARPSVPSLRGWASTPCKD